MKKLMLCFCLFAIANLKSIAQELQVILVPSNYNGYNISCAEGSNGSIQAVITNGTPPYRIEWSAREWDTDSTIIDSLMEGNYSCRVTDVEGHVAGADITLRAPRRLDFGMGATVYANGYNLTCFFCSDGAINVQSEGGIDNEGGVGPYTFLWNDGSTIRNRTGLQAKYYDVIVTDANGCVQHRREGITLSAPDRDDWQMNGNANTNPATQFLGTTDNKDFVFKTNGSERARIKSNGDFKINRVITNRIVSPDSLIYFGDSTIILVSGYNRLYGDPNSSQGGTAIGQTAGVGAQNSFSFGNNTSTTATNSFAIGNNVKTTANKAIAIGSGNTSKFSNGIANSLMIGFNSTVPTLYVSENTTGNAAGTGEVGIGTTTIPSGYKMAINGNTYSNGSMAINTTVIPSGFKLAVRGNIIAEEVHIKKFASWPPDYVFDKKYELKKLDEVKKFIEDHKHLPDVPDAITLNENGTSLGDFQMLLLKKIEELTLYTIEQHEQNIMQTKEIEKLKEQIKKLKN